MLDPREIEQGGVASSPLLLPEVGSASEASIHTSVAFLQDTLISMGIGDGLNLLSSEPAHVAATCNAIYALLLQHQKDTQFKEQLRQETSRARIDVQKMERERSKLENIIETKEREIGALSNKVSAGDDARKEEVTRARREADDLQKRLLGSERRLTQMQHEMKRKEKEYERLQERLSRYLADKKHNESAALDMAGKLAQQQPSSNAAKSSVSLLRSDEGLRAVVSAYESKQAELAKENRDLRAALSSLQSEYKEALNSSVTRRETDAAAGPVVEEAFLQQVPTMSPDQLRAELASKLKILQRRLGNLSFKQGPGEHGSIAEQRMASDLIIAKSVIKDQEQLIASVLGALRSAQVAQDAKYQLEIKQLAQRYQGQLASAESALAHAEATAADGQRAAKALIEMKRALEKMTQERDDAMDRALKAEKSVEESRAELDRVASEIKVAAEKQAAVAINAVREELEIEMNRMAAESSEIQLSLKKEQASLRAETGALRERLVVEKSNFSKLAAEKDEAFAMMDSLVAQAESRALQKAKKEIESILADKDAAIDSLERSLAHARNAITEVEAETDNKIRCIKEEHVAELRDVEARLAESLKEAMRRRDELASELDEAHKTAQHEINALKQKLQEALNSAHEREAALKASLTEAHQADIAAMKKAIAGDRATLLAKAEADFVEEREVLKEKAAQLQAQLDAERVALKGREDQLRLEARKAAETADAAQKYDKLTHHYKELMSKYAPGLGAGVFLEKAVGRRAEELTLGGSTASVSAGRARPVARRK